MTKIRPFLKWAGNKYSSLDTILTSFPKANRLIEPFAGSAAVFINSDYPTYLLGEENNDLISIYHHLKHEGDNFISDCESLFCAENNREKQYYLLREQFNQSTDTRRRAALFLYLNRHGYNGLCRYNLKGGYNVPFGRYIKPYFPRAELSYFHLKSQKAELVHGDFQKTFAAAIKGDLIYCDPPYAPRTQNSNFTAYVGKKFGEQEQIILAELAMDCANRGIPVLISNHDTKFTRTLYKHAKIKSFSVRRTINSNIENRVPVKEILAIFK